MLTRGMGEGVIKRMNKESRKAGKRKDATLIGEQVCSKCSYKMEATTAAFGDQKPRPGDISMCLNCGHATIFDDRLQLREPTPEERVMLARHEGLLHAQLGRAAIVTKDLSRSK
jgi:hypothetical protein